jgi:site-specific DNA-methyltransferase (adenine-specific)
MLDGMNTTDTILTGDCLAILPTLPVAVADLVYFDPPFNIGLDYPGYHDRRPEADYFRSIEDVFRQIIRVLSPSGSLCVQCGQTIQAEVSVMLKRLGLHWRSTIVWHYAFGPHQKRKLAPCHQLIYVFTVHPKRFTFNGDTNRVLSARQTTYKDKRANPRGRIPGDVWKISRVCGTFKERKGHCCQTPILLAEKVIRLYSNPGDLVLDPMCGTGTVCKASASLGRNYLGIELCSATAEIARQNLNTVQQMLF